MTRLRVGILSDTHGYVDPFFRTAFASVDAIVHGGDIGDESVLTALAELAPVTACRGNIDGGPLRFVPLEPCVEIGGVRIGARHICGSPTRPDPRTRALIRRERLDVLVVGHSHIPVVARVDGALWLNPGAAGRQGFHTSRHALILEIGPDRALELQRVNLEPRWPGRG